MHMRKSFYYLVLGVLCLLLASCGKPRPIARVEGSISNITPINETTINRFVFQYPGYAVVLFYNDKAWQSRDMEQRMTTFANQYWRDIRFCKYLWDVRKSGKKYGLRMLPTVVLYKNGQVVDRIMGIPVKKEDRSNWNNDINLWLQKNALGAKGNNYSGSYRYLFNNSSELQISNY